MTVLLTALLKLIFTEHSIHEAYSVICDSGPGTTDKAAWFHNRAAFLFFPMGSGFGKCANVRRSVPESGGMWGHI